MRKIILLIAIVFGFLFIRPTVVSAGGCNACGNWVCDTNCDPLLGCTQECACADCLPDIVTGTCGPGMYVCNRGGFGQCCAIGGGSCFLPGTKVETAEGSKNIETMSVGDSVKSFDGSDKVVNASVSDVMKFSRDYYYELEAGDYSVKVTAEHPFYVGG